MSTLVSNLISPVATALFGNIFGSKQPKPAVPQPVAQVKPNADAANALLLRKGSKANQRTGSGGAEPTNGGKTLLGQ